MSYKINWIEVKGPDWKIASFESGESDVSINRTSKKGIPFPNFDNLGAGVEIEGNLWKSDAGKLYLFPPEAPKQANGGAYKQKMMDEAVARKETSIKGFQESKEESIRHISAQRDSVLIVVNLYQEIARDTVLTASEKDSAIKKKIIEFRDWFLSDKFKETTPF